MARAVQHIAINCRDRIALEKFYTEHFGFRRARVFKAGQPDQFVMLRLGDVYIELFQADAAALDQPAVPQPIGFKHLAFEVVDIEAKAAALNAHGSETGRVIDCSDQVPGLKVCFLSDPEGNVIELMEGWQDDPNPPQTP